MRIVPRVDIISSSGTNPLQLHTKSQDKTQMAKSVVLQYIIIFFTEPVSYFTLHNTILVHSIKPLSPIFNYDDCAHCSKMPLHAASDSAVTQKKKFH